MARNHDPLIQEEDIVSSRATATRSGEPEPFLRPVRSSAARDVAPAVPDDIDSRFLDLEAEQEPQFLRAPKRVPAKRGKIPRKAAGKIKIALIALAALGAAGLASTYAYGYATHSWRFRVPSSDHIEIVGSEHIPRRQIMEIVGADLGRNAFFINLDQRKAQLEALPWVESAAVMRFLPDRMKIVVRERTPIAFTQVGSRIGLVDAYGVLMDLPPNGMRKYSFPVIVGMSSNEPLSTRAARMKLYSSVIGELDGGGARYSRDLSDIDLSDPDDVKVTVSDPEGNVLVHLGSSNYLDRFKIYKAHVQEWRQQFQTLESVDLRYDNQVIVNPDSKLADAPPKPAVPAIKQSAERPVAPAKAVASKKTMHPARAPAKKHKQYARRWRKTKPGLGGHE